MIYIMVLIRMVSKVFFGIVLCIFLRLLDIFILVKIFVVVGKKIVKIEKKFLFL